MSDPRYAAEPPPKPEDRSWQPRPHVVQDPGKPVPAWVRLFTRFSHATCTVAHPEHG